MGDTPNQSRTAQACGLAHVNKFTCVNEVIRANLPSCHQACARCSDHTHHTTRHRNPKKNPGPKGYPKTRVARARRSDWSEETGFIEHYGLLELALENKWHEASLF